MNNDHGFGRRGLGSSSSTAGPVNGTLANGTATGHGLSQLGVDAVVLDIDDTPYLERDYVRTGFEAVGRWAPRELGVDDFADRAGAAFERGSRNTIFDEVLTDCGAPTDDATITELVARYRTHPPWIVLAADAEAGLDRWHGVAALAAIGRLDPTDVYETAVRHRISMCGLFPTVVVLDTLSQLDLLHAAERVAYGTSADTTGDTSRVVGYAGMLFR